MNNIKQLCRNIINYKWFEIAIILVIIANSILIGIETFLITPAILFIQHSILFIFTFEIIARFIARDSLKSFFRSGWNLFDLFLVLISYIPESLFEGSSTFMVIRILRIFRVLRLLRTSDEIKLIINVLSKSFSALFYNGLFFFIFIYLFSIIGVSLFRLPDFDKADAATQEKLIELRTITAPLPTSAYDPYCSLGESMFTLFRALTGDDWTDLRYNLVTASQFKLIHTSPFAITTFHVLWFILAAFLLLNLVVGAIVNNYQIVMEQSRKDKRDNNID